MNIGKFKILLLVYRQNIGIYGTKVEYVLVKSEIYSLRELFEIPFKIPRCNVFWTPHFNSPVFPTKAKRRLTTIHDVYHLAHLKKFSFLERMVILCRFYFSFWNSDEIITVSKFSREEILRFYNRPHKIRTIANGYHLSDSNGNANFDFFNKDYILFVGNVKPHKNLKNLIKAFNRLVDYPRGNFKKIYLIIVGKKDGFYSSDAFKKEELDRRIRFTGVVTDEELCSIYRNAKVFVFPSTYEGFGLPVLEAFESRTPVIASNVASIPEVAGDGALYFDPLDSEDIFLKLKMVLSSSELQKDLVKRGLNVLKEFSWESSFNKHLDVFLKK